MANPQKENGYTKIANELYEAIIKWHFSSYEYRVLIFIIRKTYGWNKKEDWISLSQFSEATNIKESHICRTINLLLKQNIITKGGNRDNPLYSIQKDYDKWVELPKGVRSHHQLLPKGATEKKKKGVIQNEKGGNSDVKRGEIQKKLYTKETIQKKGDTPADETKVFFQGVQDILEKQETESSVKVKSFLSDLSKNYPEDRKAFIWAEIKKFWSYWTELSKSGKKQRWELQEAFQVGRRIGTWFGKIKDLEKSKVEVKKYKVGSVGPKRS